GLAREPQTVAHQLVGPAGDLAGPRPGAEAAERLGHFADVTHLPALQALQVTGFVAVAFVEGEPIEGDRVRQGAVELSQSDLPLGPVADVVGNAGPAAALAVLVPGLRQEQVGIKQRLVATLGNAGVDCDQAVLQLADFAAVLPLHTGRLTAG